MSGKCELCSREAELTKHHLIPRTRHKNKANKKKFSREDVKERIAYLCEDCHTQIHALFSEKELERNLNTLESLKFNDQVVKFVKWIRGKAVGSISHRRSKSR